MPKKTLVVYFSRAGNTARMGKEIARRCDGDVDEIREQHASNGLAGRWHAFWRALLKTETVIQRPSRNPARYDLVIIGTPVGNTGIPPAVRTYVRQHADRFKSVAFFCAEGGTADEHAFAELSRLCRKQPVATYGVDRKHLPAAAHRQGLSGFMDALHLEQSDEPMA